MSTNFRWAVVCEYFVATVTPNAEAEAVRLAKNANGPGRKCKAEHKAELTTEKWGPRSPTS
jgi:hypothetical protein